MAVETTDGTRSPTVTLQMLSNVGPLFQISPHVITYVDIALAMPAFFPPNKCMASFLTGCFVCYLFLRY